MKLLNKKFIIILRHGERADMIENTNLDKLKCGKYDTEITEIGKAQAFEAGVKTKEFLEFNEVDIARLDQEKKIKLLCSPFARTLMTSYQVLQGLKLSTPITIEKGLCEHLSEKWYPCHPEKFLVYGQCKHTQEKVYLNSEISNHSVIYESMTQLPKHPETHEECAIRLQSVYENITQYYLEKCDYKILFLVTHYFPIDVFVKLYSNDKKTGELLCEYCLTLAFSYDTGLSSNRIDFLEKIYPKL